MKNVFEKWRIFYGYIKYTNYRKSYATGDVPSTSISELTRWVKIIAKIERLDLFSDESAMNLFFSGCYIETLK